MISSDSQQWDCVSVKSREQLQRSLSTLQSDTRADLRDKAQELRRHIQSQPWTHQPTKHNITESDFLCLHLKKKRMHHTLLMHFFTHWQIYEITTLLIIISYELLKPTLCEGLLYSIWLTNHNFKVWKVCNTPCSISEISGNCWRVRFIVMCHVLFGSFKWTVRLW